MSVQLTRVTPYTAYVHSLLLQTRKAACTKLSQVVEEEEHNKEESTTKKVSSREGTMVGV